MVLFTPFYTHALLRVIVVRSRRHPNLLSHVVRAHIRPSILFEKSKSGWKGGREGGKGENTKNGAFLPAAKPSGHRTVRVVVVVVVVVVGKKLL